jgi:hypothetical protein
MSLYDFYKDDASSTAMPEQFVSFKTKKTKAFKDGMAKYAKSLVDNPSPYSRRRSKEDRELLWRFVHGELSAEDIRQIYDPMNTGNSQAIPDSAVGYNVIKPLLVSLFGEELRRRTDVKAIAINDDVINEKDNMFMKEFVDYMMSLQESVANGEQLDQESVKKRLAEFDYYRKYDLQSAHEKMANEFISYLYKDTDISLKEVFNRCWQEAVVTGEDIAKVTAYGKEIRIRKVNSERFIVEGMGTSDRVEDGNLWLEWEYLPLAEIQKRFFDDMPKATLDKIREKGVGTHLPNMYQLYGSINGTDVQKEIFDGNGKMLAIDGLVPLDKYASTDALMDTNGNYRVIEMEWLSPMKIGLLHYFDEDDNEQTDFVSEDYKPIEANGEWIEWSWANELWELCIIADEIVYCRPSKYQLRSLVNPAIVKPLYAGSLVCYGDNSKASSVLDSVLPLCRDYDLYANKLRKLWASFIGNVYRIDRARIADSVVTEQEYLQILKDVGVSIEDSMRLSPDSQQRVGNMQQGQPVANMSMSNEIEKVMNFLVYLKNEIKNQLSLPDARTGQLSGNEGLGVSQQAFVASGVGTEYLARLHDSVKTRVIGVAVEFIKQLWKDDKIVRKQYLLDDMSMFTLMYDSTLAQEAELGVVMSSSGEMDVLMQYIFPSLQALAQNNVVTIPDIVDIRLSNSPAELKRKTEEAIERNQRRQQEMQTALEEEKRKTIQMQEEFENKKLERDLVRLREEYRLKSELELSKDSRQFANDILADENGDGVVDDIELRKEEIKQETERLKIASVEKMHSEDLQRKDKELDLKKLDITRNKQKK